MVVLVWWWRLEFEGRVGDSSWRRERAGGCLNGLSRLERPDNDQRAVNTR